MKTIFLFITLSFLSDILCGQNTIAFSYDAGGNMIQRQLQVVPPGPGGKFINPYSDSEKKDSLNTIEFKIYPNPTRDVLNIEGELPPEVQEAKVFLFNTNGQKMIESTYDGQKKQLNLVGFKSGLYYLEVQFSKKNSSNYKVIITN
jgi:hypothetical protein